jgi:ribosomal subunit interface protein
MDHVAAIENYANDKLAKIEEFLSHEPTPIYIDLILEPSKVHEHHRVELRIKSPHYDMISNYEGPEFYKVLDRVIDVMLEDLHREKRKQIDERNHRIKVSKLWEFQEVLPDEDGDDDEEV